MSNMSYCRMQNTCQDLQDCIDAVGERDNLSNEEEKAFREMIDVFVRFLHDEDLLDESGEIDYDNLDSLILEMKEE